MPHGLYSSMNGRGLLSESFDVQRYRVDVGRDGTSRARSDRAESKTQEVSRDRLRFPLRVEEEENPALLFPVRDSSVDGLSPRRSLADFSKPMPYLPMPTLKSASTEYESQLSARPWHMVGGRLDIVA